MSDQPMLPEKLYRRLRDGDGKVVPEADLGDFRPGDICHENVCRWVEAHPGHRPVRGWIASGHHVFDRHSVVDTGDGWVDVTPRVANHRYPFLAHAGPEADFWDSNAQLIYTGISEVVPS
jgi:hypothetical protein